MILLVKIITNSGGVKYKNAKTCHCEDERSEDVAIQKRWAGVPTLHIDIGFCQAETDLRTHSGNISTVSVISFGAKNCTLQAYSAHCIEENTSLKYNSDISKETELS